MVKHQKLCIVGLGFVGLPLGATFAELGFTVTGVDVSPAILASLKEGKAPFEEAGLQELLEKVLGKNLSIEESIPKGEHEIYIIAVGTPIDEDSKKPLMKYVESAAGAIGKALKKNDLVIMRSTVPIGTTRKVLLPILEKESGLKAGEMGKLIDNTYRDLHFAYANQMARLAEKVGVDMTRLAADVNNGYKRNRIPTPSPGVGGICLKKDPYLLMYSGKEYGFHPSLTESARQMNAEMPHHVAERAVALLSAAGKEPRASTVFILGFAFKGKPVTSDARDAPTTTVVQALQKAGCKVIGFDPVVPHNHLLSLKVDPVSIEEGFKAADLVIIMTNHPEFESMPIDTLVGSMTKPSALLDGWHLFDPAKFRDIA